MGDPAVDTTRGGAEMRPASAVPLVVRESTTSARPTFSWVAPGDEDAHRDWDAFLTVSERGHYCQLSTFLRSYESLGLTTDVLLVRDAQDEVIGGCGLLHLDKPGFRVTVAPICPIVEPGHEDVADEIVDAAVERARGHRSAFIQLVLSGSESADVPGVLPSEVLRQVPKSKEGAVVTHGAAHRKTLWLKFPAEPDDDAWRDAMLARFSKNHRRAVRRAERSGLTAREVTATDELREAYAVIVENARLRGYPIRDWEGFGPTLVEQVQRGQAIVITASHEGNIVGASYCVIAGRRLTYKFGGILESGRDLSAGFFLQWTAMQAARRLGLIGYDLGSPSSPSVHRFKSGFNPSVVQLVGPRYVVFAPLRFRLFTAVYPLATRHRGHVERAMRRFGRGRVNRVPAVPPALESLPAIL